MVRQRCDDERGRTHCVVDHGRDGAEVELGEFFLGQACDHEFCKLSSRKGFAVGAHRFGNRNAVALFGEYRGQNVLTSGRNIHCFGQQILEVEDLRSLSTQGVREVIVLCLSVLKPKHVIEKEMFHIRWGQAQHFASGAMNDHLAEAPDLGSNTWLHFLWSSSASSHHELDHLEMEQAYHFVSEKSLVQSCENAQTV